MEIKGKVWCMFEQSGTFKQEFIKLGIPAIDLDIQNNFGQTDMQMDLFREIERGYEDGIGHTHTQGRQTIFDDMTTEDLIIAFFPCIYFETIQQLCFCLKKFDQKDWDITRQIEYAMDRLDERTRLHKYLYKLLHIVHTRKLRFILENPATEPNYLISGQNFPAPTFIDRNRMLRGDIYKKPTAYWFVNCEPTYGLTIMKDKESKRIDRSKSSKIAGLCSEERSMISSDYARNFICDFILGKEQKLTQLNLF